jgi:hypothetical protein
LTLQVMEGCFEGGAVDACEGDDLTGDRSTKPTPLAQPMMSFSGADNALGSIVKLTAIHSYAFVFMSCFLTNNRRSLTMPCFHLLPTRGTQNFQINFVGQLMARRHSFVNFGRNRNGSVGIATSCGLDDRGVAV